MFLSDVNCSVL